MKHFYLLLSLLCAYAFAATTYEQCRKDVQTISKQITILQRDVSRVKSGSKGFAFALQVQVDAVTTKKTVDQATYDANHAPNFNDDQSGPLSFDIVTLQQNVIATLNQTAKKASTFQGLKPIVLYSLYDLKKTTDTYVLHLDLDRANEGQS